MNGGGTAAGWGVHYLRPGHVAVVPETDLVGHNERAEDTGGCACGPAVVPVAAEDGSTGWMYVHHSAVGRWMYVRQSADGREALERAGVTSHGPSGADDRERGEA